MISLIESSPCWRKSIGSSQENELWHVKDVQELRSISYIEPHPVSIRLHSDGLESHYFKEMRSSSRVPMVIGLIEIQEFGIVILDIIVVRIALHFLIQY